jgi:hypothetical protein
LAGELIGQRFFLTLRMAENDWTDFPVAAVVHADNLSVRAHSLFKDLVGRAGHARLPVLVNNSLDQRNLVGFTPLAQGVFGRFRLELVPTVEHIPSRRQILEFATSAFSVETERTSSELSTAAKPSDPVNAGSADSLFEICRVGH